MFLCCEFGLSSSFFAWCGLEHYATTGSLVLGLIYGVAQGLGLVSMQRRLRAKLADLEEGSARYQKWASKRSAKLLAWLLLGATRGKQTWREQADDRRKGSPIRLAGVAVAALLCLGLYLAQAFLKGPTFRSVARSQFEALNGATVDLAHASIDLTDGKIDFGGLAMADPEALASNLFEARTLDLQVDTADLLSKRLVVAELSSRESATGSARQTPGVRYSEPAAPPTPKPRGDEKTLEDYLKEAESWKPRLARLAEALEHLIGAPAEAEAAPSAEDRERKLQQQTRQLGLARVAAAHLIEGAPMLLVRKLTFEGVAATQLGTKLDIEGTNLSSNPRLVQDPWELKLRSRDDRISVTLQAAGGSKLQARMSWKGITAETVASLLSISPLRGGTVDLALDATFDSSRAEGLWVKAPLQVTLHDTALTLPGLPETQIDALTIPIGLRGPLASPRISLDDDQLMDALVAAGKKELANKLRGKLDAALGERIPGIGGEASALIEGTGSAEQLTNEAKKRVEEEAKKRVGEELKKVLPGGLFGGKKKKGGS